MTPKPDGMKEMQEEIFEEWRELYFGLPSQLKTYSKWLETSLIKAREELENAEKEIKRIKTTFSYNNFDLEECKKTEIDVV